MRDASAKLFAAVLILAIETVAAIALMTNRMAPAWDMLYYVDIAEHGIIGNPKLFAPFAYRSAAPLTVGFLARLLGLDVVTSFRICAFLACVAFVVACFYFAAAFDFGRIAAVVTALAFALYIFIIKWNVFSGTMVDVYTYPLLLLAFWAMLRRRVLLCILVSGAGLLFKEFLLLPLLTQAVFLLFENGLKYWRKSIVPLALTALALAIFFVLPRALIHVNGSLQSIDPIHNPASLKNLLAYPLMWKRNLNLLYSYAAFWLPVLLLVDRRRLEQVRERWRGAWIAIAIYMIFLFVLVLYGGTNLMIFVTYSLPVAVLVLAAMVEGGGLRWWEPILVLAVVFVFNRDWAQIPPPADFEHYIDFFGGYHNRVNEQSYFRMAELILWIAGFWSLRSWTADFVRCTTNKDPNR